MSQANQAPILQSAVRQQLDKILSHDLFTRSDRMARFLRLAVEWTLDGKGEELKEYLVGVEVFDRSPDYDPRVDPIVRVEARRLRSKLKAYYEGDGLKDIVVIEFPRGSYAPRFRMAGETEDVQPAAGTIAVLPFVNLSANPENEYFSDGLTEELIHALTKAPEMRVMAWNTATHFRHRQEDIAAVRKQLKVANVLTGSVRIAGASLRVRAQLIDTASGVYLWSETFDRELEDVIAIQEEIAGAIVRTLRGRLRKAPPETAVKRWRQTSPAAYNCYLKGRYVWHRRTPDGIRQSVKYFQSAIEIDPQSALAYAGLADAYSLMVDYELLSACEGVPLAREAAERAIALDPDLGEAYTSLALIRGMCDWEWDEAERLYRRAIELNPGYATAHFWLACDHLAQLGRLDEALAEADKAAELDPLSSIILEGRGQIRMLRGDYEGAIAGYREILTFDPGFYKAVASMGRAYSLLGRFDEALKHLEKARSLAGDLSIIVAARGHVFGLAGDRAKAREILGELEQIAERKPVACVRFALIHIGLGEFDRALDYLECGCERREPSVISIGTHPIYRPLHGLPRYQELLRRLRLA